MGVSQTVTDITGNAGTATKLQGVSGNAPSYSARAWVNFNGTGTVAINASGNVSSITDNGVGDYTINFQTAMPNANYAVVGTSDFVVSHIYGAATWGGTNPTASACRVATKGTSMNLADGVLNNFVVFG